MNLPMNTQIQPKTEPEVRWGVHFVHENVVSDYGPGELAKEAAENSIRQWADSEYPAELVSQVILPWRKHNDAQMLIVRKMRSIESMPWAIRALRDWLTDHEYEKTSGHPKTYLAEQVPMVKVIRKLGNEHEALEFFMQWMRQHGYVKD